jgi:hypothetical protein
MKTKIRFNPKTVGLFLVTVLISCGIFYFGMNYSKTQHAKKVKERSFWGCMDGCYTMMTYIYNEVNDTLPTKILHCMCSTECADKYVTLNNETLFMQWCVEDSDYVRSRQINITTESKRRSIRNESLEI